MTLELGGTHVHDKSSIKVTVRPEQIFIHPEYNDDPVYVNDIAVIKLAEELKFDKKIGIDMVDKNYVIKTSSNVTMLGLNTKFDLHAFSSKVVDFSQSQESYIEKRSRFPSLDPKRYFFVKLLAGEKDIGTAGFSGGI